MGVKLFLHDRTPVRINAEIGLLSLFESAFHGVSHTETFHFCLRC